MKSRLNLKPGQKGTKKLVDQFGKSLLYVRYRYDEIRGIRLKTVEIVVEEKPWKPRSQLLDGDIVPIRIAYDEKALRDQLKALGGRWDPEEKLWYVSYAAIRDNELEKRIPVDFVKKKRKKAS